MCIISGPVLSVNSTKLLALPSKNGKRQLTVYRNSVTTPDSNAMCLPVPNPHTLRFEKVPKDIFEQCKGSFDIQYPRGGPTLSAGQHQRSVLSVQSHGSYEVVLVPSMNDLDRVPTSFTTLTPEVIEFLNASYPENFGVILCKLKKGSSDYEPFAYSHEIQGNKQLFFPTKHYHVESNGYSNPYNDGTQDNEEPGWAAAFTMTSILGGSAKTIHSFKTPKLVNTRFADDWDHEIYSAATPQWCHESRNKKIRGTNEIKWSEMPEEYQFGSALALRCKEIVGNNANIDIEMPIQVA